MSKEGWAMKDGRAVHISEVSRGLDCDCFCPGCLGQLVAKKGDKRRPHFAHSHGANCGLLGESALHLVCKEIVQDVGQMELPDVRAFHGVPGSSASYESQEHDVVDCQKRVVFDEVELEKGVSNIVPDIVASKKDKRLCIEIKVTHAVDKNKARRYAQLKQSALEIDVSDLPRDADRAVIQQRVIDCTAHKKWIFNQKAADHVEYACVRKSLDELEAPNGVVSCPLPPDVIIDGLPDNGWKSVATKLAKTGKVRFLYLCVHCKHALCTTEDYLFCDADQHNVQSYKKFPVGF